MLTTNKKERRKIWLRPDLVLGGRKFRKWIFLSQITNWFIHFCGLFIYISKWEKWKCAKEFLQRCKIVGVSPKEFIAILTPRPGQVQFGLLDWNPWEPKHGSIFKGSQFLLMWGKARKRALLQYQLDLHPPSCCRWKWARSVSAGPPWRSQDGTANRSIHPLKRPFCHHFSFPASF